MTTTKPSRLDGIIGGLIEAYADNRRIRRIAKDINSANGHTPRWVDAQKKKYRNSVNLCRKIRKPELPYEIWESYDGTVVILVVGKKQSEERASKNPLSIYTVYAKSKFTHGEWEGPRDSYRKDVINGAFLVYRDRAIDPDYQSSVSVLGEEVALS